MPLGGYSHLTKTVKPAHEITFLFVHNNNKIDTVTFVELRKIPNPEMASLALVKNTSVLTGGLLIRG